MLHNLMLALRLGCIECASNLLIENELFLLYMYQMKEQRLWTIGALILTDIVINPFSWYDVMSFE